MSVTLTIDRDVLVETMATHKPLSGTSSICANNDCRFIWKGSLHTPATRRGFAEHVIDAALAAQEAAKCPTCHGSGEEHYDGGFRTESCHTCGGTGKVAA